jgi:hypothetical protein
MEGGRRGRGKGTVREGVELTKVKHTQQRYIKKPL